MSSTHAESVAIIGGGFSGVMTGVNLARLRARPLHLTLINQSRPLGRGAAYGTRRPEHLLNVAARNMSAFPDQPDHFLQWLRTRFEYEDLPEAELRGKFVPRRVYGDYLSNLLREHLRTPGAVSLEQTTFLEGEVVAVQAERRHARVQLADGREVRATKVVLATGNEAPAGFPGEAELAAHPGWVGNPWVAWEDRLPAGGGNVVVLGTGLSAVDALLTLQARNWTGTVQVVSRHARLPEAHFRGIANPEFPPPGVDLTSLGLTGLVALMERHCARLRAQGANPAIVVDQLRPHTQRIWRHLSTAEKREFIRDHAARWNVLRHRIAPEIHAEITAAVNSGRVSLEAARVERVVAEGPRLRVELSGREPLIGDLVINATGPQTRFTETRSVLLQNLLRTGLVVPDELDLGLRVDEDHTVLDRSGARSPFLLALGPLLRGTLWETIAVPELRGQARRVAETILDHPPLADTLPPLVMMEYMI